MTPAIQREKALFEEALSLTDPDERRAFLDRACGADTTLRSRLEELFAAQEPAETFLTLRLPTVSRPPVSTASEPSPESHDDRLAEADVRIGRYKLMKRLGEGGCGVVYLAEQQEPVHRQVALKIIRLGIGAESIIARFQMERQALAWMDHPNIARVLDAGATETGRPYFVMELVHGTKITDYCNQHRLDIPRRLELFAKVCHAIQHAHQKGVIHRDIKPSNILIASHDGVAVPKVIDFGIAKPITARLPHADPAPPALQFAGTPDYVSPEQAGPDESDVDTRSDIYSLGVLLYELLTGRTPFDSRQLVQSGADDLCRAIRERPSPPPPSAYLASLAPTELARLAGQRGGVGPRALVTSLRGDLDCIVMRALEKDRRRRYDTANGLALDLRRYLDHEPVSAHPPTRFYHLRKLVRRNRQVYIAGGLVLTTLVAGLGASTWLFYREREARREQALLRAAAEMARANELVLRQRAEAREKIAHAAVELSHNNIEAADALVSDIPLALIPPSLESAEVLRVLGGWHASAGRWPIAAERFRGVAYAITSVDSADTDDVSRDLLSASAAICEAGDVEAYEQFRQMAIARFGRSAKPIPSEHTIKSCLLTPADHGLLRQLSPLAEIVETSLQGIDPQTARDPYMAAWKAFALALFEYRRGNYERAVAWTRRCEAYRNDNAPRLASSRLIFAMASHHLHRDDEARAALQRGRDLVEVKFRSALDWGGSARGFWFDWVNARLLLREASAQIEARSATSP